MVDKSIALLVADLPNNRTTDLPTSLRLVGSQLCGALAEEMKMTQEEKDIGSTEVA